jgi:hypothetical protein
MAEVKGMTALLTETLDATRSRRHVLALLLGAAHWFPAVLSAAESIPPVRLAISESLVGEVNLNDARAAMSIWLKRMIVDLNIAIEYSPKVFDSTGEIIRRARNGQLDCVALNVVEYRQIADFLDPSQIIAEGGTFGVEQYLLLAKRNGAPQSLAELKGRKLCVWTHPKMCVASAWLSAILDEGHLGQSEPFFRSINAESQASRVVLPVFFGQSDACVTSKRSFDTMCELNPQVAKTLTVIASSPEMVVTFYIFRKAYHGISRESFARVYTDLPRSAAGRQLATLFQFENLVLKDVSCLAPALKILDIADRVRSRHAAGSRKS